MGSMVPTMSRARRLHGRTRPSACIFMILALAAAAMASAADGASGPIAARVARVLKQTPLIDGHNDLPWEIRERFNGRLGALDLKSDTSSLARGPDRGAAHDRYRAPAKGHGGRTVLVGVGAGGCAGGEAVQTTLEQIDLVKRLAARYPADLEIAYTAADVRRIHRAGKIASLIGIEGGHQINNSLGVLRQMYDLGARYMTLTHDAPRAGPMRQRIPRATMGSRPSARRWFER